MLETFFVCVVFIFLLAVTHEVCHLTGNSFSLGKPCHKLSPAQLRVIQSESPTVKGAALDTFREVLIYVKE